MPSPATGSRPSFGTEKALLLTLGCDEGQGFFFARPMPFEDLTAHLALASEVTPSPHAD